MDFREFQDLVVAFKQKQPVWFGLDADAPATEAQLQDAETEIGVSFPEEYRRFLKEYGGGFFAFAKIYSVQPGSDLHVLAINRRAGLIGSGLLAFSDNGVGDLYGFKVGGGDSSIWFLDHETRQWQATHFSDLIQFLVEEALRQKGLS